MVIIEKGVVDKVNSLGDIAFTTVHSHISVRRGEKISGIRVIPLSAKKKIVDEALKLASSPPLSVAPFKEKDIGLIVTGNEVSSGRIEDGFRPVIEKKVGSYNSRIKVFRIAPDDAGVLENSILELADMGCDFIILTGGMSVDPDDTTKTAIRRAGLDVVSYGVPVLPGNMFMAAYIGDIPVFGVPACALYFNITVLDLFLPYAFSGTRITREDIGRIGYGGYCRHCDTCVFPYCGFGKC